MSYLTWKETFKFVSDDDAKCYLWNQWAQATQERDQQERFKWEVNKRADAAERDLAAANERLRDGIKWLKDSTFDERSFHEDAPLENGIYHNDCVNCGRTFVGYKRRTICKVCSAPAALPKE